MMKIRNNATLRDGARGLTALSNFELEIVVAAGSKPGGDTGDPPEKPKPKPKLL